MWRNWNPLTVLAGMKNDSAIVESSLGVLRKLNIELPYDPAIKLLGIHLKKWKTSTKISTWTHMFMAALFVIVKK